MAFANSPPVFMTVSGSVTGASEAIALVVVTGIVMLIWLCHGVGANGGVNNLREDQYDNFANYLATVVKHFQSSVYGNVQFDAVTPLNEPVSGW